MAIYVHPLDIVEYYQKNKLRLMEYEHKIAESPEEDISMYIVDDGFPIINVYIGDTVISENEADEDSLMAIYQNLLEEWGMTDDEIVSIDDDEYGDDTPPDDEPDELDQQEMIEEREDQLNDMVMSMIFDILGDDIDEVTEVEVEDAAVLVKEAVCDILARRFKLPVYRPMFLRTAAGERFFAKYPYPQMISTPEED